jgi:hypothetical protein
MPLDSRFDSNVEGLGGRLFDVNAVWFLRAAQKYEVDRRVVTSSSNDLVKVDWSEGRST